MILYYYDIKRKHIKQKITKHTTCVDLDLKAQPINILKPNNTPKDIQLSFLTLAAAQGSHLSLCVFSSSNNTTTLPLNYQSLAIITQQK
jgi:hypothetical protein